MTKSDQRKLASHVFVGVPAEDLQEIGGATQNYEALDQGIEEADELAYQPMEHEDQPGTFDQPVVFADGIRIVKGGSVKSNAA